MPPLTPRKRLHEPEPEPASTPIHNRATTMHAPRRATTFLTKLTGGRRYAGGKVRRSGEYCPDESGNAAITAMKDYLSPEWVLINTSNHCDASSFSAKYFSLSAIKPDIGLYEASKYNPDSTTNSASVELFGEFKVKKHDDPFPPAKTLPESAKDTRGQITLYLNAIQAAQQRTRVFLFFILGDQCRLFCHSRAGTQYTDPFNHTTMPYLHEFLWRLTHSSPADCGHDVTMEPVLPAIQFTKKSLRS
ncbi:hypothetical protein BDP27DRAFT_1492462 [Rhodocollybia butyracea]|uniref:Uncharacterized protein n=1 Tax=Rhodocollybia butyracea TaxID=206335 RepID=A0A9P5PEF8_9AGAR|nr:hypothetical protein BDP27DRAFT_1492462 [Rhodocollybia butyracea]